MPVRQTSRPPGYEKVLYQRGTSTVFAPEQIYHNIIMYENVEGARITVLEYNLIDFDRGIEGYEFVDKESDIGDVTLIMLRKEMQPSGGYRVWYRIEQLIEITSR